MSRQAIIRNLSNAINYFDVLKLEKIDARSFEESINTIEGFIQNKEMSSSCPQALLENIFTILVSKYYQIFTQNRKIIAEQYLQNKYASVIKLLYEQHLEKGKLTKNIFALCLSANINKLKQEIAEDPKSNQTVLTLLKFNLSLLREITSRTDFKIKEFYPKIMSLLSNGFRKENLSLKAFQLVFQTMKELIKANEQFSTIEGGDVSFGEESTKRLTQDLQYLINKYYLFQANFRAKLKNFSQFLLDSYQPSSSSPSLQIAELSCAFLNNNGLFPLKTKLFSCIVLFAQMNEVLINLQSYPFLQKQAIRQSYTELFLITCKKILKIEVNIELKKQELSKLIYLISYIQLKEQEQDETTKIVLEVIQHLFHIRRSHTLICIPHHASTIPLDPIQPSHTKDNYPIKSLQVEYDKEFRRMLTEIIPFYELQTELVATIRRLFDKISNKSRLVLLRYFNDALMEQEYQLDMSLTKLYNYLSLLLSIKYLLMTAPASFEWYNIAYSIFDSLGSRSQSVKTLKASYIEEQLLISTTIEIICLTYRYLSRYYQQKPIITNKIRLTQSTIILIEKILNSLSEQSYLIRLVTTDSILSFAGNLTVSQSLQSIQAALIHRNKNNLELMLNILTLAVLNPADYEELAQYYMNHHKSEVLLRTLLPKISVQSCRKCLLTVQKWWLLLTREVIEYLNCKQMKSDEKLDNFYIKDGENVLIKNALGVIILELSDKWTFYLHSQKREVIVDIILELAKTNPGMVFFRSFFSKIIKEFTLIIRECLGYQHNPTSKKGKSAVNENRVEIPHQKVEFYDRLRLKIYEIFTKIPKDSYQIFEKEILANLKQILESQHQQVKMDYLFNNNLKLKHQYDLGKLILAYLQSQ